MLKDDGQGKGGKGGGRLQWVSPLVRGVMGEIMEKENQRRYGKGGYDQITHTVEENKNQLENLEKIWGGIAARAPWNTVAVTVLLRTGSRHCKNSMRMRRCRLASSPFQD